MRDDCVVGDNSIIARNVSVNYNTKIGSYTKIMDNSHITGSAVIEDHVFISVLVATTNENDAVVGAGHGMYIASLISTVLGMELPGPGSIYRNKKLNF